VDYVEDRDSNNNQAFIDIGLRPGIATPPEENRATVTGERGSAQKIS